MDEYLIRLSESDSVDSTVDFFRKYMAGFLISRHESTMSLCGSDYDRGVNDSTADTEDLMCMMYGATNTIRSESFFMDTVERQEYLNTLPANCIVRDGEDVEVRYASAVSCSLDGLNEQYNNASEYDNCNNVNFALNMVTVNESFMLDSMTTNISLAAGSEPFQVDGAVRDVASSGAVPDGSSSSFGRRYAEVADSVITGATIYYNNQVIHIDTLVNTVEPV